MAYPFKPLREQKSETEKETDRSDQDTNFFDLFETGKEGGNDHIKVRTILKTGIRRQIKTIS